MKKLERIGVSLEKSLLSQFDKLITGQGYQSRSEAIRDLIRQQLSQQQLGDPKAEAAAAVFLVYDHHQTKLMEKLAGLQHNRLLETISSMHIHLDRHNCLEIIVLKGKVGQISKMANEITSLKGVKFGRANLIATETA